MDKGFRFVVKDDDVGFFVFLDGHESILSLSLDDYATREDAQKVAELLNERVVDVYIERDSNQ